MLFWHPASKFFLKYVLSMFSCEKILIFLQPIVLSSGTDSDWHHEYTLSLFESVRWRFRLVQPIEDRFMMFSRASNKFANRIIIVVQNIGLALCIFTVSCSRIYVHGKLIPMSFHHCWSGKYCFANQLDMNYENSYSSTAHEKCFL